MRATALASIAAGLAVVAVVAAGPAAQAAVTYELVAAASDGSAVAGATAGISASADGRVVAFGQQGAGCAASTVYVRDRQAKTTTSIGAGLLPAITQDGARVAFVSCTGPEVSVWAGGGAAPITNGEWRANGATQITDLAVSAGSTYVAFIADAGAGTPAQLWVVNATTHAVTLVETPGGPPSSPALSDDATALLAFVSGGVASTASAAKPGATEALPQPPGAGVTAVSVSANGRTVAMANGSGVFVSVDRAATVSVTTGGHDPSVSFDGANVAVAMASGAVASFTTGATPAQVSAATPSGGGFSVPVVSNGGRELIFIATPGTAAGGTGTVAQAFALRPSLSVSDVDFGPVGIGETTTKPVTFQNTGTVAVTPSSIQTDPGAEFTVTSSSTCVVGQPIAIGASCVVQVAFTPSAAGARSATLTIAQQDDNWDGVEATSRLTGEGANGALSADPTTLDFGTVTVGQTASARSFTVTNSGSLTTTIGTLIVSAPSEFPLAGGTCAGATLAPAATCTVSVTFKPAATGARTATMDVGGSGNVSVSVALEGTGRSAAPATTTTTAPPPPALSVAPTALDFGTAFVGASGAPQTVTIRNSGRGNNTASVSVSGTNASDFAVTVDGCGGRSLAAGATCTVTIGFSPRAVGARTATLAVAGSGSSSASVRLSGTAQLDPVITVTPAVVVPGQVVTVAGTNFPAGASVTLAWDLGGISVTVPADATGVFSTAMVTPGALGNGTRLIAVTAPAEATSARASVLVQPNVAFQGPGSPPFIPH